MFIVCVENSLNHLQVYKNKTNFLSIFSSFFLFLLLFSILFVRVLNTLIIFLNVILLPIEKRKARTMRDIYFVCYDLIIIFDVVKNYLTIDAIVETFWGIFKHINISMSVSQTNKRGFFLFHHANIFGGIQKAAFNIEKKFVCFGKERWREET